VLDQRRAGGAVTGELRFDLGGGRVLGQVAVAVLAEGGGSPQYQSGGPAKGGFNVRIGLDGIYGGGLFGQSRGSASISGTFLNETKCQANVGGQGTFHGNISGPIGVAIVVAEWAAVRFEGCGLASVQRLSIALPLFTFAAIEDVVMKSGVRLPPLQAASLVSPSQQAGVSGPVQTLPSDALARGYAFLRQERFREALQAFDEVLQRSALVEALLGRGQARSAIGDTAGALQDFETALRERPVTAQARIWMAELWLASGDYTSAQTALTEELRLAPDSALARSYVGSLQILTHKTTEAKQTMAEAVRFDPAIARKRYDRGVVLTSQRQPRRAAIEFTSALAFNPPITAAYFGLGLAMTQLGQTTDAIRMFEQYVALEPSTSLAIRARQEITRLKVSRPDSR
jgi:Tfp pilus assembly protein PilF